MKKIALLVILALSSVMATAQTTTADLNQGQQQDALAQASNAGNTQVIQNIGAEKQDVHYSGDYTVKNVPSVSGPNLTTSNDTCMGSTSGSANAAGIGIGFGTTWTDEHCKALKSSRELWNKGMKAASLAIDCMNPQMREAIEMTGTKCPQSMTAEERRTAFGPLASVKNSPSEVPAEFGQLRLAQKIEAPSVTPVADVKSSQNYAGTDPIVLSRMRN